MLCRHVWVMSAAHHLTEANIQPKFKENPSRGIGDMERTRNSRLKPMTLTLTWVGMVDLLVSAHWLIEANIWPKFNEKLSKVSGDTVLTRKCYGRTDGWMDRQIFHNPPSASWGRIKNCSHLWKISEQFLNKSSRKIHEHVAILDYCKTFLWGNVLCCFLFFVWLQQENSNFNSDN